MKKFICIFLIAVLTFSTVFLYVDASGNEDNDINNGAEFESVGLDSLTVNAKSAVLMDANTGTLLYAKNPNEALPPASVTKVMTLLLVAEAIADERIKPQDKVYVSANASSMGGSQIFLKEGEKFTVEELLKSTVIASANDAAVALAELVGGSESAFVSMMNKRASELGLRNTYFENTTGLDDDVTKHLTSAYDIALMSRELIKHEIIMKYSKLWQDSIRGGEFILTNTNRLVRFYSGCTGLKTGSTDKAGFCVSATAERDGMHLIAVVMGSETRDERNESARAMLDYGFSNYALFSEEEYALEDVPVFKGSIDSCTVYSRKFSCLINKADIKKVEKSYDIPEKLVAPLKCGDVVGKVIFTLDGKEIGSSEIIVKTEIEKISAVDLFIRILKSIIVG